MPLNGLERTRNDHAHWYVPGGFAIEALMRNDSIRALMECAIAEGRWSDAALRLMPDAIAALPDAAAARDFAALVTGICIARRPALSEHKDGNDADTKIIVDKISYKKE